MNAEQKIKKALLKVWDEGKVNASRVFKGYDRAFYGWHVVPFGSTGHYLGDNLAEALEEIDQWAEAKKEQG